MKECPQSPSSPAGLIHWLLFVRTFWTFYMNSDSCCAKAGGSVVPHGPWKWCLENITRKLRVDDAILALGSEVLADLREVFCFRGCFGVEFCHWNAPGGNQGAEHGCGVHDGGGAHLQVNREPIKTCEKRLDWKKKKEREQHDVHSRTHHKAKVTDFHLFFHFGQDVRVQGFSKKYHVGPQQTVAIALVTP